MANPTNDNDGYRAVSRLREPDAHGQAALLLVESLIHSLVARSVISAAEAAEIVEVAADVRAEISADLGYSPASMDRSLGLLAKISASLRQDAPGVEPQQDY